MKKYQMPVIINIQNLNIPALTQSGSELTGLTGCGIISDCPPQSVPQSATFHLNLCTLGITDPSDLNGSSYVIQKSGSGCTDFVAPLSNCTATNNISCDPGSFPVSCEYTASCSLVAEDCAFISEGVSTDGNYIACPPEA